MSDPIEHSHDLFCAACELVSALCFLSCTMATDDEKMDHHLSLYYDLLSLV